MYNNLTKRHIILLVIAIVFIIWLIYRLSRKPETVYKTPLSPVPPVNLTTETMQNVNTPSVLKSSPSQDSNILYNFYSPKCPHCQKFSTTWQEIEAKLSNNKNIITRAIDVTLPENDNIAFYYNVTQLPTLILATPDKNIEYTGDRTLNNIYDFVVNNI